MHTLAKDVIFKRPGSRHEADFTVESLGVVHWNVTFTIANVIRSFNMSARALLETNQPPRQITAGKEVAA